MRRGWYVKPQYVRETYGDSISEPFLCLFPSLLHISSALVLLALHLRNCIFPAGRTRFLVFTFPFLLHLCPNLSSGHGKRSEKAAPTTSQRSSASSPIARRWQCTINPYETASAPKGGTSIGSDSGAARGLRSLLAGAQTMAKEASEVRC